MLRYNRFTYSHTICYLRKCFLLNCSPWVAGVSILGWGTVLLRIHTSYVTVGIPFAQLLPLGCRSVNSRLRYGRFALSHTICYLRKYFLLLLPLGRRSVNSRLRYDRFAHSHTICYLRKYFLLNCSPLVAGVSILGWGTVVLRIHTPYVTLGNTFCSIAPPWLPDCQFWVEVRLFYVFTHHMLPEEILLLSCSP